jgi:hypothetical protein
VGGYNVGANIGLTQLYEGANSLDLGRNRELDSVESWSRGLTGGGQLLLLGTAPFSTGMLAGAPEATAAEGTAQRLMYHYTTADESLFANGLREGSSVTDRLYTDALRASQELGIPVPNKVIPIQDVGQFVPAKPPTVQPSFRFLGGGNDFNNLQRVPTSQLLPAQPIGR